MTKTISLLPADTYNVICRTIISAEDKKNIISLYEPIIGPIALALYFTLEHDLKLSDIISSEYTHHHLMTIMRSSLDSIKLARETLEAVGLLKTYYQEGNTNSFVYELYSPLTAKEFFNSPIFNITLYNNIGKSEYDLLKYEYQIPKIDLKEYEDISKPLNLTFKSSNNIESFDVAERNELDLKLDSVIDFDLVISSLPKGLINEKALTKKTKELIEQLAFIYNLDTLKMVEILRMTITEKGTFDREEMRKTARKYYQYNNNGKLPTLVYRTQPDYLKSPVGDKSTKAKIIYMFENTTPYDFLKMKNKGVEPSNRDLKIIEGLMIDLELSPSVVNVLIDYVLRKNNNKLNKEYMDTIGIQWRRSNIKTAEEAMAIAKKENNKITKKIEKNTTIKPKGDNPAWFNMDAKKEEMSAEEIKELEELLKEYR